MAEHDGIGHPQQAVAQPQQDVPQLFGGEEAAPASAKKTGGGRPQSLVWQFYTKTSENLTASKRYEVACNACKATLFSRVEQMEAHLASSCEQCTPEVRQLMRERIASKAEKKAHKEKEKDEDKPPRPTQVVWEPQSPKRQLQVGLAALLPEAKRAKIEAPSVIPFRLRFPQVYVPSHPLVNHWLAVCRNKASPPPIFRSAVAELGRVLIYEAAQDWLPTVSGQVETPLGPADCSFVDPTRPVKVVPILRAGLVLLEQAATVLPSSETYHVGYVRDEKTLEASEYLNKLPPKFAADDRVLVCDPMLATGGTMLRLLNELVSRGASQEYIRVISVVVAPPALNLISKQYPGLRVYCGMVDEALNEQGMIVPGLGDAGDRAFGTA